MADWTCGRCHGSGIEDPFDGLDLGCVRCDGFGIDPDFMPELEPLGREVDRD